MIYLLKQLYFLGIFLALNHFVHHNIMSIMIKVTFIDYIFELIRMEI